MSRVDISECRTDAVVKEGFWLNYGKRIFDFIVASILLVLLSVPILFVTLTVWIKLGSPVFFSQRRLGQHRKEFTIYKFRSMTDERDENGELLPDEYRLTRFGSFLRRSSIDEIPQFINVIKGDISFIGPRATLPEYLSDLQAQYPKRFLVPQGITSLPAISGRNALNWETKLALDIDYVESFSFKQDMKILFATIPVVLMGRGVNMPGFATAKKYEGSENK